MKFTVKSLVTCCLLTTTTMVMAQQTSPSDAFEKNDLGISTNFLIQNLFSTAGSPATLMYKRNTSENSANRFGISASLSSSKNNPDGPNTSPHQNYSNTYVDLSFGKEKRNTISKSWMWYFGGDILPSYSSNSSKTYDSNNVIIADNNGKQYGLTARPFMGIRFNISPKLYLSAEAAINIRYLRTQQQQKSYNPNSFPQEQNNKLKGTATSLNFVPASGLFIYYRF